MTSSIDQLMELAPGLDAAAREHVRLLMLLTSQAKALKEELEDVLKQRNVEIANGLDQFGIDKWILAKATGMSETRVNQILAEVG